ncbi:hypothetical protein D3C85_517120 [compost metagenome]
MSVSNIKSAKKALHLQGRWVNDEHTVRSVLDSQGNPLGVIRKLEEGGYRVYRHKDGKIRDKESLDDAFRTLARAN